MSNDSLLNFISFHNGISTKEERKSKAKIHLKILPNKNQVLL